MGNNRLNIIGDLWMVAGKMRSLGELLNMSSGDPPFSDEGLKGLSHLLLDLACDVEKVGEHLERCG